MAAPERLVGVHADALYGRVLPAVRGHIGIRSGDLVVLAREYGLQPPTGDPAARGPEWVALIEGLAGVTPLAGVTQPPRLMPVLRDLTDLVEGSIAPVAWWQRLTGGGAARPVADAQRDRLHALLTKLTSDMPAPPELARPLLGRLDGLLTEAETNELADRLSQVGRETWVAWGAGGVSSDAWPDCYDALSAAAQEAVARELGLLYGAGY